MLKDHDGVPVEGARKIHPDLCYSFMEKTQGETDLQSITVWHWCDRRVRRAKAEAVNFEGWVPADDEYWEPRWSGAGVGNHNLVSLDPLHLEPSLYWPDCCGAHGFLRNDVWTPV